MAVPYCGERAIANLLHQGQLSWGSFEAWWWAIALCYLTLCCLDYYLHNYIHVFWDLQTRRNCFRGKNDLLFLKGAFSYSNTILYALWEMKIIWWIDVMDLESTVKFRFTIPDMYRTQRFARPFISLPQRASFIIFKLMHIRYIPMYQSPLNILSPTSSHLLPPPPTSSLPPGVVNRSFCCSHDTSRFSWEVENW